MTTLINLLSLIINALVILLVVDAVLSFLLSPYHPVRQFLGRVLNPLLNPIRRVVKPIGGLDFSPLVLILLLQILGPILIRFLWSLAR